MSEWFETLDGIQTRVWQSLGRGVADRLHPARHPTLATISPDGWPEARTVVLRSTDLVAAMLTAHTDLHSAKVASLRATPRAALHVWIPKDRLQLRLTCTVSMRHGADVADIWAKVPDLSRQSYGITPAPGTPIDHALAYVKVPDAATFVVLNLSLVHIDAVHLGDVHRRARFQQADDWAGQWLVP
jgi:pyridoxamine 5'-phosphate oxidase